MLVAWLPFAVMLFVLEPFVIDRVLAERARRDPVGTMAIVQRLHVFLLVLTLAALVGGVGGVHGGWFAG